MVIWHQSTVLLFLGILIFAAITTKLINNSMIAGAVPEQIRNSKAFKSFITKPGCYAECFKNTPLVQTSISSKPDANCPGYFRWIHEDLKPWKDTGISKEMIERAKGLAHFRLVIISGKVYVEKYKQAYQTRDAITIWGILQLLRMYPGKIPDVDMMFECDDKPIVKKNGYGGSIVPPPLFRFCGDDSSFDIVFPDWSFWGWPELNIQPWEMLKKDIERGNEKLKWMDREPYAYWKGNTELGPIRSTLAKCNASENQQWNAQIYNVDWRQERKERFQTANLSSQCTHRYKVYVEGRAWSVSQKYILACDSVSLFISPHYYDFFTRNLLPTIHYWPINQKTICSSIKFAVDWGNKHSNEAVVNGMLSGHHNDIRPLERVKRKFNIRFCRGKMSIFDLCEVESCPKCGVTAQEIGKSGSKYVQEQVKMKYVYDYIFHLLQEYAKLLKYRPVKPEGAVEICPEAMICPVKGMKRRFRANSMVHSPSESGPCALQPSFEYTDLQDFVKKKEKLTRQVELLEANENIRKKSL